MNRAYECRELGTIRKSQSQECERICSRADIQREGLILIGVQARRMARGLEI